MNKDELYIKLLLETCLNFKKSKSLFICYEKSVNSGFVDKIILSAHKVGIRDIYLYDNNLYLKHDVLLKSNLEEIENNSLFNCECWNEYAKKNASFLIIESELPGLMQDIDPEKINKMSEVQRKTKLIFKEKELIDAIPWCICAYPNEIWAKDLFGEITDAYQKLYNLIMDMCMINNDSRHSWLEYIDLTAQRITKLNDLEIESLHYYNSLGTDLTLKMPINSLWVGVNYEKEMLVNMPSYEIFSSPYKYGTEGIVYSSKPLIYNGREINDFWLKFKDGKVIDFDAKKGKDILKGIIESDNNAIYLGEVSLVNYDSPISKTNLVYKTTLFDENAACHLALGASFPECIKNGEEMSKEDLENIGLNYADNHVDFMVGTKDLTIEATTKKGKILLFKDGNFSDL